MAIRKTLQIGNKILRSHAKNVTDFSSPKVHKIIRDLTDSMRHENLVGIAAPQIGEGVRIFVSEIRKTKYRKNIEKLDSLRVFINPKVIWQSKNRATDYEGCGSVASGTLFGKVSRPQSVTIQALSVNGEPFQLETSGLLARIIQHEIDHLNGVLFIDHVRDTRKLLGKDEFLALKKRK